MNRPLPPVEQLLSDIASTQARVRARAAKGLGECKDDRAVEPLIVALGDRTVHVRLKACSALGQHRDPRSVGPLIEALRDVNAGVRFAAGVALKKLGKAAYAPVLEAYKTGDPALRLVALGVLARSRSAATSELLIAALDDPDLQLRMEAARVLGQRKERKAVERLIAALDRADASHWLYVWALGEIGDPRAFEPLQARLDSPDFQVRSAAVKALRQIDNPQAVDLLHERLDDPVGPDRVRLAQTLAGMDLLSSIQSAFKAVPGGSPEILKQAAECLGAIGDHLRSSTQGEQLADTAPDQSEAGEPGVELMRALEAKLRGINRKP